MLWPAGGSERFEALFALFLFALVGLTLNDLIEKDPEQCSCLQVGQVGALLTGRELEVVVDQVPPRGEVRGQQLSGPFREGSGIDKPACRRLDSIWWCFVREDQRVEFGHDGVEGAIDPQQGVSEQAPIRPGASALEVTACNVEVLYGGQ